MLIFALFTFVLVSIGSCRQSQRSATETERFSFADIGQNARTHRERTTSNVTKKAPTRALAGFLLGPNRALARPARQRLRLPDPVSAMLYVNVLNAARQVNRVVDNVTEEARQFGELRWDANSASVSYWDVSAGKAMRWDNAIELWMPCKYLSRGDFEKLPKATIEQVRGSGGLERVLKAEKEKTLQKQTARSWRDAHSEIVKRDGMSVKKALLGEWKPVLTSAVTHRGAQHLYANMIALCIMGTPVLHAVGSVALLTTFLTSLFTSKLASFAHQIVIAWIARALKRLFRRKPKMKPKGPDTKEVEELVDILSNSTERVSVGLSGVVASLTLPYLILIANTLSALQRGLPFSGHRDRQWFEEWIGFCSQQESMWTAAIAADLIGLLLPFSPVGHAAHVGGLLAGMMLTGRVKHASMYDASSRTVDFVTASAAHESLLKAVVLGLGMIATQMLVRRNDLNWQPVFAAADRILKEIEKKIEAS